MRIQPEGTVKQALQIVGRELKVGGQVHLENPKLDTTLRDDRFLKAREALNLLTDLTSVSFAPTMLFLLESTAWSDWEEFSESERIVLRRMMKKTFAIVTSDEPSGPHRARPSGGAVALMLALIDALRRAGPDDGVEEDADGGEGGIQAELSVRMMINPWIPTPADYLVEASIVAPLIADAMEGSAGGEFLNMIETSCSTLRRAY